MKNFKRNLINICVVSSFSLCLFACSEEEKLDQTLITEPKVVQERNSQGYEEVLVSEKGFGKTRDSAIGNALKNCLAKVLGVSLNVSQHEELNVTANLTDDFFTFNGSLNSVEDINLKLNGGNLKSQIKRYEVKQIIENDKESYEVIVSAVINRYQPPKETKRKRIAVLPLRISNQNFCISKFADNYSQSISNFLVKTNNFAIIDRDYSNELDSELFNIVSDSNFSVADRAKLGNKVVADYIFVGTLDEFNFTNRVTKESYTDEFRDNLSGNLRISWKLLDVATGLVVDSSVNSYRFTNKDLKGSNDQCFIDKFEPISKEVGMRIVDAIYPIAVVGCSNNYITLARGGDYIKPQQLFNVYRMGDEILDPNTNESLGKEEILLGKATITDTSTKLSHASFIDSNIAISDCKTSQYIVRLEKDSSAESQPNKSEQKHSVPQKPKF